MSMLSDLNEAIKLFEEVKNANRIIEKSIFEKFGQDYSTGHTLILPLRYKEVIGSSFPRIKFTSFTEDDKGYLVDLDEINKRMAYALV